LYFGYGISADLFNIVLLHGALLPFMTDHAVRSGDFLFKRGDAASDIFYLVEGKAEVVELGIEVAPGHLVGEVAMFTPNK